MKTRKILISGAGIAGPTLAWWLRRNGLEPTLVENAPTPRIGGYLIDFWGIGYDVAERMGLTPDLHRVGYDINELRLVDARGDRIAAIDVSAMRHGLGNRLISIARSDLANQILDHLDQSVEIMFGDSIVSIDDSDSGVTVGFEHAPPRRFDLVIGADGLHSTVRRLAFGPDAFETHLGYQVAACGAEHYPHRDEGAYVCFNTPGRQAARYALRDGRTVFFFIFVSDKVRRIRGEDAQRAHLRAVYGDAGWECPEILAAMDRSEDLYFDDVSQIRMPVWSRGRVALIGDACFCPSLLAGQGASLAMGAAFVLAGELKMADGDYRTAFRRYQDRFSGLIAARQRSAERYGLWFAPSTRVGLSVRNQLTCLMSWRPLSNWMFRWMFTDHFDVPEYA